jgi:peptidyl-prolyl cis-trans isomerase D
VLAPFRNSQNVTGEQMLGALASQIRLNLVRQLPGLPEITPLDVLQAYRDRYELITASAVRFPVADFLSQVREPSKVELTAFYDRYKAVLPEPSKPTPGFKIPRLVQVEFVSVDGETIARDLRRKITEKELADYYESRKTEFPLPPMPTLPDNLFADDPQNEKTPPPAKPENASPEIVPDTSPHYRPLVELHDLLETDLSREKAREVVDQKFTEVRDVMIEFDNTYSMVQEGNKDARERGGANIKPLPRRPDLRPLAEKAGLTLVASPPLTREAADHFGEISTAHVGASRMSEGRKFVDEMFTPNATLYEPIELANEQGQYFLAWKIADNPPRVPPLQEIRTEVVRAWKTEQARPLARKAAEVVAEKARKAGGKLTPEITDKRPILTTERISKLEAVSLPMPGMYTPPKPRPTEIPQIPEPSEELRDTLFSLDSGEVAVEPDQPLSAYYVLVLNQRFPVDYRTLFSPNGPRARLQMDVRNEARERQQEAWISQLRAEAGLKPDWKPPEDEEIHTRRGRS